MASGALAASRLGCGVVLALMATVGLGGGARAEAQATVGGCGGWGPGREGTVGDGSRAEAHGTFVAEAVAWALARAGTVRQE